ncbi:MAG: hypothetical protein K0S45_2942 [Nitrospira sp.]|nr:hypothetical protein [Nitrospira sp.]
MSIKDRRTSRRLDVHLTTVLRSRNHSWKGITKSIGFGGFSMTFVDDIPAILNQHITLGFSPGADQPGTVGIVCGIRGGGQGQDQAGTTLAVKFVCITPDDEQVLTLLFNDGQMRSREVRLTASLSLQENEETLVESVVRQPIIAQRAPARCIQTTQAPRQERRRHRRVACGLDTEISLRSHAGDRMLPGATTKNLTSGGACLSVRTEEVLIGSRLLLRWAKPTSSDQGPTDISTPVSACSVVGEVMWTRLESEAITSGAAEIQGRVLSAGVRFLHGTKDSEEAFERFLAQMEEASDGTCEGRSVTSEFSECFRPSGSRIVLCHDRPRMQVSSDAPLIVLAPGYGESKRDYVPLAYCLAGNGFHVVRYDNVNHVGESDGMVTQFRLQDMESDLEAVLDHLTLQWPDRRIGLVATSLAGRVALKVAGRAPRVQLLILINGIMDVRHTLQAVHQEDLIGEHLAGVHKGVVNILGLTIDADRWLEHAVKGGYADLATTQQDAERLRTPVVFFHAEHDAWVDPASIHTVEHAIGPYVRHSYVVPGALHRLQESPRKARAVYRQITSCFQQELWPDHLVEQVMEPSHREIGLQNRIERERGKGRRSIGKSDHVAFWKDYLHNFQTIPNVADFWRLMDQVYRLMGDCHRGERILDAGCGNGNFGVFLQLNQAFRQRYARRGDFRSPDYVGVDFVPAALSQAMANFEEVGATLRKQFPIGLRAYSPMSMRTCRADLEWSLPFPDQCFDRVVCNLVIGYVRDPLFTLREYLRVLAPHGRLVISNLKPYADLSAIYRSFVETARTPDQVEEGRRLLDNSGKIKAREGEGVFHFFHQTELENLLQAAGVTDSRVYSTFGNQALIAVAEKGMAQMTVAA